jgi:rhomboid protease GluP
MADSASKRFPIATVVIVCLTGTLTGLQFVFPVLLTSLRRVPNELTNHDYWRLLTSLLVHNGGWRQIAFNLTAIAIVGTIVERIFGTGRWLILYFAGGFIGQIAGLCWKPLGAGASVAGAGLLGALAIWMILHPFWRARIGGAAIICGACTLAYFHDLHGPPLLAGAALAFFVFREVVFRESQ